MPRNGSGVYTLPAGNPVESGTLIEANWANSTLNDLANEITDSLSRSGEGGMLAPFRLADGLQATPGIAWLNEPSTGFYRAGAGEMWGVVGGTQVLQFTGNGLLGRFTSGSVTTPSITRSGDLNTGIYFPGADEIGVATGGVLRLSIDSAGAVNVPGNFSVGGTFAVTGGITFSGNATVGGTLGVTGATTLSSTLAVTGAITASGGVTGNLTGNVTGNVSGNAGTVTNGVYTTGDQTIGGTKTFSATIVGSVSGNAGTVTNGVYTTGSYSDPSWLVSVAGSKVTGNISGNAATATTATNVSGGTASVTTLATSSTATIGGQLTVNNQIARVVDTNATLQLFKDATPTKAARVSFNTAATDGVSLGVFNGSSWIEGLTISSAGNATVPGTLSVTGAMTLTANPTLSGGTANGVLYLNGSKVATSGSALVFDGANLGLGATPSAWTSNIKALEGASGGALAFYAQGGFPSTFITSNAYSDGTNWIAKVTDQACLYTQEGTTGKHIWSVTASNYTAGNPITFTQAMTLDSSGNLGIGTTSPSAKIHAVSAVGADAGTFSDGSTYTLAIRRAGSTGTVGLLTGTSGSGLAFGTNNVEVARFDTSGNLGIGTASPFSKLQVTAGASSTSLTWAANGTSGGQLTVGQGGYLGSVWVHTPAGNPLYACGLGIDGSYSEPTATVNIKAFGPNAAGYGSNLCFYTTSGTSSTERARITADGSLLVGTTTDNGRIAVAVADGTTNAFYAERTGGSPATLDLDFANAYTNWNSSVRYQIVAGGSGGVYLATGGTSWTAVSDERKKDIIEPITNAAEKVASLRAVIGKYKTDNDGVRRSFLIAQDVQAVLPEAVDATDEDQLGLAYTDTIPLLVAAIKEQQAMIEELKAKVAALEAR